MKVIFVEPDRCLGCRNCERVCSFQDSGGFKRADANIWVHIDLDKRRQGVKASLLRVFSSLSRLRLDAVPFPDAIPSRRIGLLVPFDLDHIEP